MIAGPRYVFDTGALIKLERQDRRLIRLVEHIRRGRARAVVPRVVIAEVWRGGSRQAHLARLLRLAEAPATEQLTIDELTPDRARQIGKKIGECGHDDIVDVNVALCARNQVTGAVDAVVLTADRSDILRVDPDLHPAIVDV
ncbi:PIN domain-containing protein [Thermoactinospora rubra]|uniref:PIN domain-containing protein n=1 Tax=Thermoactinospora rubra TaxID=1088767 RepID=UPI000A11CF29|nr:PIN domain-containing protein [Thermoactinospora rubra]